MSAAFGLSFLIILNAIVLFMKIAKAINWNYEKYELALLGLVVAFILINYIIFLKDKKYIEIEKRFKKETNERRILGNILVSLYVILTLLSPFFIKI